MVYDIYHCCVYIEKLLMVDRGTVRNMWSFISQNKFEKLVHLVGFIVRIYHDARSPERQKLVEHLRRIFGRHPFYFYFFKRFTCFYLKRSGTYLWKLHETVRGQRISTSGPRVILSEIWKCINTE